MPKVSMQGYRARYCAKPNCQTGNYILHRHHRASEKLFIDVLHYKNRGQRWYQQMVSNYYSFRPRDIVYICTNHHAEIHEEYAKMIGKYIRTNGPPHKWTKQQAENLMSLFRARCRAWLRTDTPGLKGGFDELVKKRKKAAKK